ncbi:uncharacterized protein LOC125947034 [Dermacentor silvarum]|uniref:uncharacterized protein LOC125947034 n=1 Tax=Dermacentor silvarum TaxID=543639 RepID=UPI002100E506|nr:uncharacterized protein LOC125947034 [Dermacentor silvarum]
MADPAPATAGKCRRRPSVLQWNTNSLRRRHAELCAHLLQCDFDVLALQEVYTVAEDLRLPGYTGYSGATTCSTQSCMDAPCLEGAHKKGKPRTAIYVRSSLAHTAGHDRGERLRSSWATVGHLQPGAACSTPRWARSPVR